MKKQREIQDEQLAEISGGGDALRLRSRRNRSAAGRQFLREPSEPDPDPAPPETGGPGVTPEAEGENDGNGATVPHLGL